MTHGIKEVTFNSGSRDAGKLSIQALVNRYITATRLMRESPDIVDNARDVASRQREKAKQEIVELILANNGDDSFKVMLSTATGTTVSAHKAVTLLTVANILVSPSAIAVTLPSLSIVPIFSSSIFQVTVLSITPSGKTVAISCAVSPTDIVFFNSLSSIYCTVGAITSFSSVHEDTKTVNAVKIPDIMYVRFMFITCLIIVR